MLWTIGYNISHYFKHLRKTEKIYHFFSKKRLQEKQKAVSLHPKHGDKLVFASCLK